VTPEELALAQVVRLLEDLSIPYMVTGSVASSHHGRPRMTHDIDIVIDPGPQALARLVEKLGSAGFCVDASVAQEALRQRRQFNVIEPHSGSKLDLIVRKDRPFSVEELSRRQTAELAGGTRAALATAEDTILSKLEWAKRGGGSERQIADVAGVLAVQGGYLDREYVERWARRLGVLDLWEMVASGEG